jgi:hypothetical protein
MILRVGLKKLRILKISTSGKWFSRLIVWSVFRRLEKWLFLCKLSLIGWEDDPGKVDGESRHPP